MVEGVPEVPGMAGSGAGDGEVARSEQAAGADPLYEQALACVQQGRWAEAEELLGELQVRYAGSAAVQAIQEAMALHLSAEQTWGAETRRRVVQRAPRRTLSLRLRVLIIANLVLYSFVVGVWLLLQIRRIIG